MAVTIFSQLSHVLLGSVPMYVDTDHKLVKWEEAQVTWGQKLHYICSSCRTKVRMNYTWQMLGIWLTVFLKAFWILQQWGHYKNLYKIKLIFQSLASMQWGYLVFRDLVSSMVIFLSQWNILLYVERVALSSQFWGLLYTISLLSTRAWRGWLCTHIIPE